MTDAQRDIAIKMILRNQATIMRSIQALHVYVLPDQDQHRAELTGAAIIANKLANSFESGGG
jgi:hypothetical protein